MNETNWQDILSDIEEQQAVLLLGHGFLQGAQSSLNEVFQNTIREKLLHFYQRDGLFLFESQDAKVTAQEEAVSLYEQCRADEALLRKIAELPFKLMVSANPDKNLPLAFARYRLPLQFDYFSSKNKDRDYPTERPSAANPLLY